MTVERDPDAQTVALMAHDLAEVYPLSAGVPFEHLAASVREDPFRLCRKALDSARRHGGGALRVSGRLAPEAVAQIHQAHGSVQTLQHGGHPEPAAARVLRAAAMLVGCGRWQGITHELVGPQGRAGCTVDQAAFDALSDAVDGLLVATGPEVPQ